MGHDRMRPVPRGSPSDLPRGSRVLWSFPTHMGARCSLTLHYAGRPRGASLCATWASPATRSNHTDGSHSPSQNPRWRMMVNRRSIVQSLGRARARLPAAPGDHQGSSPSLAPRLHCPANLSRLTACRGLCRSASGPHGLDITGCIPAGTGLGTAYLRPGWEPNNIFRYIGKTHYYHIPIIPQHVIRVNTLRGVGAW